MRLTDANGVAVTTLANAQVTAIDIGCPSGSSADRLEEVSDAGSELRNLGDGDYQLDWKSPASYAGSCKRLRLDLFEGSAASPVFHTADFRFRK